MTATATPYTAHVLDGIPEDGRNYEMIDGMLYVGPAPSARHQMVVYRLHAVLDEACPDDQEVIGGPFAVRASPGTELRPDLVVAWRADLTEERLPAAPLLVVEVLSPSTVLYDVNTKRAAYQRMGTPSYWVIEPETPTLTVFELDESGRYQRVADVAGDVAYQATRPFPLRIVPTDLLSRTRDRRDHA